MTIKIIAKEGPLIVSAMVKYIGLILFRFSRFGLMDRKMCLRRNSLAFAMKRPNYSHN